MSNAHKADELAGQLARILHGFRGPRESTLSELGPYLNQPLEQLFPTPPPLGEPRRHGSLASRFTRTTTLSWESRHDVLSPAYRLRHERDYRRNHVVWARWLRPDESPRKECLVYVHGWLEPGSWVEEAFIFPRWARELDVDLVHVALPFHGPRNPRGALFSGEYFWTADLVRSIESVRQAICDIRGVTEWLRSLGYQRVGTAGISMGGSLTMLLACLPRPPDYIVPIVAHLMLGEAVEHATILWRVKRDLERFGAGQDERRRIFQELGWDSALPLLPPEKQLWIEAREDGHIDPALVDRQWRAWGRPNIHWLAGGHMTFPLHLPEISGAMREFLRDVRMA